MRRERTSARSLDGGARLRARMNRSRDAMKLITAIKPFKLDDVRQAVADIDGKIFVSALEPAVRIRTGEMGTEAV